MKSHHSIIISSLLFALFTATSYAIALDDCSFLVFNNDLRYDVCAFNDKKLPFEISYDNRPTEYYNISLGLTKANVPTCTDPNKTVFSTIKDLLKESACSTLASTSPDVTMIDSNDENSGLVFTYPKDTFGKSLIVSVKCDEAAPTGPGTKFTVQDITDSAVNIIGSSSSACPTSHLSKFIAFLHNYKNIFFVLFLVLGLVICFFGFQLFNVTVFTLATIAGTGFTGILVFFWTDYSTKSWTLWLLFAVCLVIGLALGILALKLEPLGFLVLGIVLGVVAGSFLYNAAIAPFFKGSPVVLYLTEILSGIIGALLAYKLWKDIIMIGTAYIGAYMICKSLAAYIGGFPTEDSIADGISNWTPETYIYLALIVILTFFGGITQYRRQKAEELVNEEANRYARVINGPDTSDI